MTQHFAYPKVLLVGRTNVGKSTIFNRIAEQKLSMVFDRAGVTRDYLQELITWKDKSFILVDTGGLSFARGKDDISQRVQSKVLELLNTASLILFVVDGKNGLIDEDHRIAEILRRAGKPVIVLVNKADNQKISDENLPDFYELGFENLVATSGVHGSGIGTILGMIAQSVPLPSQIEAPQPSYNITIIGKPNAGKSSLMNLLIKQERSIVSPVAGTTREAVSELTYHCDDLVQITDTAGVRRPRKVEDDLEQLMVKSSLQAVRSSDIIILVIDASEGKISDQELKLLFYAYEQKKMLLVVFNKTDLLDEYRTSTLKQSIDEYKFILNKLPQLWISCITEKNVGKILHQLQALWQRCSQPFDAVEVDDLVKRELVHKHLYHTTEQLKVHKIVPLNAATPTFALYVNYPEWFGPSEVGCIENILRNHYDLLGCPISFVIKGSA
ncbi:MAG: ribosome biogenesis GTPase Der [Candidatus Babeliales bacterium]|jgi:GTP-binding protein